MLNCCAICLFDSPSARSLATFAFARREPDVVIVRRAVVRRVADAAQQHRGNPWRQQHLVAHDALQRGHQLVDRVVSSDVAGDPGLGTGDHLQLRLLDPERDDLAARRHPADAGDGVERVTARDVEEDNVGADEADLSGGVAPARGDAHHVDVGLPGEQLGEAFAEQPNPHDDED